VRPSAAGPDVSLGFAPIRLARVGLDSNSVEAEKRIKTTDPDVDDEARKAIYQFGGFRRAFKGTDQVSITLMTQYASDEDKAQTAAFWTAVHMRVREIWKAQPWWRRWTGF
jgi:hypothetical protein